MRGIAGGGLPLEAEVTTVLSCPTSQQRQSGQFGVLGGKDIPRIFLARPRDIRLDEGWELRVADSRACMHAASEQRIHYAGDAAAGYIGRPTTTD